MNVSIIVPVYNSFKTLKDTLESLVKQTMQEIEIICIDDASTDKSYEILKAYETKYPEKIKVYQNKSNKGQGATRNLGIKVAKGKYIGFVDSDDYVNFKMYETMYQGAVKNGFPEVVTTGIIFVKDNYYLENNFEDLRQEEGKLISVLENPDLILNESPSACNKIFRSDSMKNHLFLEGIMWEDVAFSYAKMLNASHILTINAPNYFYKRDLNGVSGKGWKVNPSLLDIFKVADRLEEELRNSRRYDFVKEQVKFIEITTCLQRVQEIMSWPVDEKTKENLCKLMEKIIMQKYGDWRSIPIEQLSSKVGFLELEKMNAILNEAILESGDCADMEKEIGASLGKLL